MPVHSPEALTAGKASQRNLCAVFAWLAASIRYAIRSLAGGVRGQSPEGPCVRMEPGEKEASRQFPFPSCKTCNAPDGQRAPASRAVQTHGS